LKATYNVTVKLCIAYEKFLIHTIQYDTAEHLHRALTKTSLA